MKYPVFLISIALITITITHSCTKVEQEQEQERTVTCVQYSDYKSIEKLKIDTICTSEICIGYFNLWKKIFKEQNNISDAFFDEHIVIRSSVLHFWNHGVSYRVRYYYQMDWATVSFSDQFMVKIYSSSNHYNNLPREIYLSEEEIKDALSQNSYLSEIVSLSTSNLMFTTMDNALNHLIEAANVNTLCTSRIYLDDKTGHIMLEAWAEYENEDNSCIRGLIDLINGETEAADTVCWDSN